jgi:hypothetical protein
VLGLYAENSHVPKSRSKYILLHDLTSSLPAKAERRAHLLPETSVIVSLSAERYKHHKYEVSGWVQHQRSSLMVSWPKDVGGVREGVTVGDSSRKDSRISHRGRSE